MRPGMRNDDGVAMIAPERRGDRAHKAQAIVPLIAARIVARAVRAIVVPAIAAVLDCLDYR